MTIVLSPKTAQGLIKAAIRQKHAPGKYDLFAWQDGRDLNAIAVAWQSFTKRSVALENMTLSDGEEIQTNSAPLPNGVGSRLTRYVGSFRIDKRRGEGEP
ncbi:MAG: hypothetical protein JSR78_15575 [Proteobacteria bacterium]|nr:hypothetical protein [Pseudomonadota bacterium]